MIGADDQRHYFRMLINTEVQLEISEPEGNVSISAICRDLSATGMGFEVEQPIEIGTVVTTKIEPNNTELPSLNTSAKVIRCIKESENHYLLGVEVIEIS